MQFNPFHPTTGNSQSQPEETPEVHVQPPLVVLGSAMSGMFAEHELEEITPYAPSITEGHPCSIGKWKSGDENRPWIALGRRHVYESGRSEIAGNLVDEFGRAGGRKVILTSAVGGLNPALKVGDIVLHTGYVTILFPRFLGPAADCDSRLATLNRGNRCLRSDLHIQIMDEACRAGIRLCTGSYAVVHGPSYETRAEIRALRRLGADIVGMSVVPELLPALQHGMDFVSVSLVTNSLTDTQRVELDHTDVMGAMADHYGNLKQVIAIIVANLKDTGPEMLY